MQQPSGSFDVLTTKAGTDPVRVALYNEKEEKIWSSSYGDAEGSWSERGQGKHWLCLENGHTWEMGFEKTKTHPRLKVPRKIGFSLRVKKAVSSAAAEILGDSAIANNNVDQTQERLLALAEQLTVKFEALTDHMSFMKAREIVHRELHEQTFTKVVRWNLLEIFTVVIVSFGQVLNVWWILSKRNNRNSYY